MNKKLAYLIVGLLAILIRLFLNFRTDLIPGLNGGYYPVQIRALLLDGQLAFPDLPLLFYLNAFLVKIGSLISPGYDLEKLIILVSKTLDSLVLPLIILPMYLLAKNLPGRNLPWKYEIAIVGFLVLSYAPLELSSDFQKNAFALPFMLFFIYYFLDYLKTHSRKALIVSLIFFTITGFTHFGVFSVCLIFFIVGLSIFHGKKAIIPILIISILSLSLIVSFDIGRGYRLLLFWRKALALTMESRIFLYPYGIINYIFTYLIILLVGFVLMKQRAEIHPYHKRVLLLFLIVLVILSFPFLKFEYGRRLTLIIFVPIAVLLVFLYPYFRRKTKPLIFYALGLLIAGSLLSHLFYPKPNTIVDAAYNDLGKVSKLIEKPKETIIFTRHGLDWWIAWKLGTNVAISYRIPFSEEIRKKYEHVLIINQKTGRNKDYPGEQSPFTEPSLPEHSKLIYSSEYFDLYKP